MATLDSLQVASGPLADLGYSEEVSYGKIPPNVALKTVRRRSTTFALTKDSYQSEEVRPDRMVSDMRHGIRRANGDVVTEISPGSHADFFEALLGGYWQSPAAINANTTNLTATLVNGYLEVTATSYSFITAGLLLGSPVTFTGTASSALNGKLFTVVSHAANKVVLLPPIGFTLPSPAALSAGFFGIKGARVGMGNIYRSFVFERAFTDIGTFHVYTGQRAASYSAELPPTGIATGTFSFMGQDELPTAYASIDGVSEVLLTATQLTSLTFNAAAGTITAAAGSFISAGIKPGDRVLISGDGITDVQNRNPRTVVAVSATVLTVAEAIQSGGPYTGSFEVLRVGLPAYTQVSDEPVLVAVSGALLINGQRAGTVTGLNFSIDNQMGGSEVTGANVIPATLFGNQCVVSGQITVLFDRGGIGASLYSSFKNEDDNISIVMRLDKADASGGVSFVFPRTKISTGSIGDAVATGLPVTAEFTALRPLSINPGAGNSQVYIYDTTVSGVSPAVAPLVLSYVSQTGGTVTLNVSGGQAPYTFDPDTAAAPVTVSAAGNFTHAYGTNGSYVPTITDSAVPNGTASVAVTVTTGT